MSDTRFHKQQGQGKRVKGKGAEKIAFFLKTLLTFSLFLFPFSFAIAAEPGSTTGTLLKIPTGGRATGMGEAFSAIADDVSALHYNPAGLVQVQQKEASFTNSRLFESISYNNMSYAHPTERFIIGGSLSTLSYGSIDGYDKDGNAIGSQDASSLNLTAGAATNINRYFSVGANLKFLNEKLAGNSASTVAGDLGTLYVIPRSLFIFKVPQGTYRMALVAQNLGQGLSYGSDRAALPRRIRAGLGVTEFMNLPMNLDLDVVSPNDSAMHATVGMEYWLKKMFAVRLGYSGAADASGGFRGGMGLKIGKIQLDYGYAGSSTLGSTHRLTFSFRFGRPIRRFSQAEKALFSEGIRNMEGLQYVEAIMKFNELLEIDPANELALAKLLEANESLANVEVASVTGAAASQADAAASATLPLNIAPETGYAMQDPLAAEENALPDVYDIPGVDGMDPSVDALPLP